MKKLMIATPALGGTVNIPYLISFSNTILLLKENGVEVLPLVVTSGSLLVAERNRIIQAFWDSDCTHLLCIDSDLGWPAEAVIAMLQTDKEFVAGCYPARNVDTGEFKNTYLLRAFRNSDDTLVQDTKYPHLVKAEYVPAGFMLISKSVVAKMRDKHPDLYYEPKHKLNNPAPGYCFFNTEVWEGEFWGEDFVFCRKAREAGVEIWVDPLIQFNHAGAIGMLAEQFGGITLNQQENVTLSEAA